VPSSQHIVSYSEDVNALSQFVDVALSVTDGNLTVTSDSAAIGQAAAITDETNPTALLVENAKLRKQVQDL